jgi:hypothetical protein
MFFAENASKRHYETLHQEIKVNNCARQRKILIPVHGTKISSMGRLIHLTGWGLPVI